MTYSDIVSEVLDYLNLTSDDAVARVEKRVNQRYREILSALGLEVSQRVENEIVIDPTDPDSDLPDLVVNGMEKVLRVQVETTTDRRRLDEKTYDEVTERVPHSSTPSMYAMKRMGSGEVTITFDGFPSTDEFTILVEGLENTDELAFDAEPLFPSNFHDMICHAVKSDELMKMEKPDLAAVQEQKYLNKLSDLRYFISKSAYLDLYPGKTKFRRWYNRNTR